MSFLFSSTTTFDELLEKATSEVLPYGSEVMEVNLEICDLIRGKTVAAATAAKAIKRKINHRNPNVQLLALKLTDICVKNGGHHFLVEVASKDFLDNLESLLNPAAGISNEVVLKILSLIQAWGIAFKGKPDLGYATDLYEQLKRQNKKFPPVTVDASSIMIDTKTAPEWSDSEWCMRCRSAFTMLNRKHHCRNCGLTFCGNCSSKSISLPHLAIKEPVRVCESCYTRIYSGDIKAATALAASGGSSSDLAALTAGGGNTTTAANTNAEDEDLRKAIEASLRESQKSSTIESKPATVPVATRRNDADDDDADLKAAIEASLRESSAPSTTSYNNNKSSSNQAPSYAYQPPVRSQSTSSNMSNNTSSNNNNPYASAAYTANSPSSSSSSSAPLQSSTSVVQQYMPNELSSIELENIKLFSELVEKMELDFAARGPSILNNPQIQTLYVQMGSLQSKISRSLDDASAKYQQFLLMNEKLTGATKMYDQMLQYRLTMATSGRLATGGTAPPPQPYGGYQPLQPPPQQSYYPQQPHQSLPALPSAAGVLPPPSHQHSGSYPPPPHQLQPGAYPPSSGYSEPPPTGNILPYASSAPPPSPAPYMTSHQQADNSQQQPQHQYQQQSAYSQPPHASSYTTTAAAPPPQQQQQGLTGTYHQQHPGYYQASPPQTVAQQPVSRQPNPEDEKPLIEL